MIYLDNAATTYPKPEAVYLACDASLRSFANAGRGAHKQAMQAARVIYETRLACASMLGTKHAERLIFTSGCTQAINMALRGFGLVAGDCVVVSALEHNAVMRTLYALQSEIGIKVHVLPYARERIVNKEDLVMALTHLRPRLCVISQASNVTGEVVDLETIGRACRDAGTPLMVDAAQSAGFTVADLQACGVSIWCAAGHKALMGPPGVGLLYVAEDIHLSPIISGGTGSRSEELAMPEAHPDHLEVGTQNAAAIAGLGAAIKFVNETGLASIIKHKLALTNEFRQWASTQPYLQMFGPAPQQESVSIAAFRLKNLPCDKVADILDEQYDIAVRAGLHCAQAAHNALGTTGGGLVRASFGYFNTEDDVNKLCLAIEKISCFT
jgi:cysteine desulfurase family protein